MKRGGGGGGVFFYIFDITILKGYEYLEDRI